MLAAKRQDNIMKTSEGEVVERVLMKIGGVEYNVIPLKEAGKLTGYSSTSMWRFVDEGTLIAYKIAGTWWTPISEIRGIKSKN